MIENLRTFWFVTGIPVMIAQVFIQAFNGLTVVMLFVWSVCALSLVSDYQNGDA